MHFTGTVYRNPYWPTWPLLEITQGCTHNRCKFCTMYKDVPFKMSPMEWIEEDLREIARLDPDARTIQLLSANPLALAYDRLRCLTNDTIFMNEHASNLFHVRCRIPEAKEELLSYIRRFKEENDEKKLRQYREMITQAF